MNFNAIFDFFGNSSFITYIVLFWLSLYFLVTFSILFSRLSYLSVWKMKEKNSLEYLLTNQKELIQTDSILRKCENVNNLEIYKNLAQRKSSIGLTWLSIIASTSPFIGLFGTVISILETFGGLGSQNSLSVIAPKISEALVATACGILVAIPAYTFHLVIKKKAFEILSIINSEIQVIKSKAI